MAEGLQINKEVVGDLLTVHIKGDLNVKTSPILEEELKNSISGVKELVLGLCGRGIYFVGGLARIAGYGKGDAAAWRQNETSACQRRCQRNYSSGGLSSSYDYRRLI